MITITPCLSFSLALTLALSARAQIHYEEERCNGQAEQWGSQEKPEICWGEWRVKSSIFNELLMSI